jgi:DNA-binding MarR family transcriptional regulator
MEKDFTKLYLKNQLCFPLYAGSRLTTKLYQPHLQALGITYPQYIVLMVLWEHESLSVKDICGHLFLESNTVTPLINRLVQKQLVLKKRSEIDERTVIVSLTSKGKALKEKAVLLPDKIFKSIQNSGIEKNEIIDFQKSLTKLLDKLGDQWD